MTSNPLPDCLLRTVGNSAFHFLHMKPFWNPFKLNLGLFLISKNAFEFYSSRWRHGLKFRWILSKYWSKYHVSVPSIQYLGLIVDLWKITNFWAIYDVFSPHSWLITDFFGNHFASSSDEMFLFNKWTIIIGMFWIFKAPDLSVTPLTHLLSDSCHMN